MKNSKITILSLILFFSMINFTFSQVAGVTSIGSTISCPGTIISVPLNISGSSDLGSISLRLDYEGTVLSYTGYINFNPVLGAWNPIAANQSTIQPGNTRKKLMLIWTSSDGLGHYVSGTGTGLLCYIQFRYLGGTTNLEFNNSFVNGQDCEYSDGNASALTDNPSFSYYINGTVSEGTPSQPGNISGNTNPGEGNYIFSVLNDTNAVYTWSNSCNFIGSSNGNSINYIVGTNSTDGIITVIPSNACGNGLARTLTIVDGVSIDGHFTYKNSIKTPLDSVKVFLVENGIIIDSSQTDDYGFYSFQNVSDGVYEIHATTHKIWSGVNATDAVKTILHFTGSIPLTSSIQLHAADVNLSYNLNTTDAVKINRRFVGADSTFTRGNWIFEKPTGGDTVDVSYGLNDTVVVNGVDVVQNFVGIVTGDVNHSYIPQTGAKSESSITLNNNIVKKVNNNEYFEIPVRVSENMSISAISLILDYPQELIQIEDVRIASVVDNNNVFFKVTGNKIRFSWFQVTEPININANEALLIIRVKSINFKSGNNITIKVENNSLCEIADNFGEPYFNVTLNTDKIEYSGTSNIVNLDNQSENNLEIYPNPAINNVNINCNFSSAENVTISIFNLSGEKVVNIINNSILEGNYHSNVNISNLPSNEYVCRMITGNGTVITKKLIISK